MRGLLRRKTPLPGFLALLVLTPLLRAGAPQSLEVDKELTQPPWVVRKVFTSDPPPGMGNELFHWDQAFPLGDLKGKGSNSFFIIGFNTDPVSPLFGTTLVAGSPLEQSYSTLTPTRYLDDYFVQRTPRGFRVVGSDPNPLSDAFQIRSFPDFRWMADIPIPPAPPGLPDPPAISWVSNAGDQNGDG